MPGNGETSYAFLNFSHPEDAKNEKARRTVRSHVTRQQHQKEQLATAAAVRRSSSTPRSLDAASQHSLVGETAHSDSYSTARSGTATDRWSPTSVGSSPGASASSSPHAVGTSVDPRQLYPAQWLPYVNVILDNYVTSMAHNILDTQDQRTTEALRTIWMPFVVTDAALLHATLLVGTSYFGTPPLSRAHSVDVLQLRGMTIAAINDSTTDPTRWASDHMIAASLSLAQYEAFWGEKQAFAYHMHALKGMVQWRGGLAEVSATLHGLLEKMIRAIDYHTSGATGTEISFGPAHFPSSMAPPTVINRSGPASLSRTPP